MLNLLDEIIKIALSIGLRGFLAQIVLATLAVGLEAIVGIVLKESHAEFELLFFSRDSIGGLVHASHESLDIILALSKAALFDTAETLVDELFSLLELLLEFTREVLKFLFERRHVVWKC